MADEPNTQAPDLAGYPSVEELARAYRASSDEGKRQRQRADELERQFQQAQMQSQRPQDQGDDPVRTLRDFGIPVEALDRYVENRVRERVTEGFAPIVNGMTARPRVMSEFPEYGKYEADVASYVGGDPGLSQRYQQMFSTDPQGAMEWAFMRFGEHQRRNAPKGENRQAEERAEARIPSSRTVSNSNPTGDQNQVSEAADHYRKTGDPMAYFKARMRQVVPDSFLNGQ